MEPDRFRVADTRGWFAAADTDFRSAEADLLVSPAPLSKYASRFRYPGAPYKPTLEEAENAFKLAREVVAEILARLPPEVGL